MSKPSSMSFILVLAAAAACQGQDSPVQSTPMLPETVFVEVPSADPELLSSTFCGIASSIGPSVVTITSRSVFKAVVPDFPSFQSPFGFDPWGGFGMPVPREQEFVREGLGSGVIIDPEGFIVTNNHVVEGADELEVILQDGTRFEAALVGTDPKTDLAVVRIEAGDAILPAVSFGDAESLRVGQIVLAVGSPFALSSSVTQGIISYIGRTGVGLADYEDFIQTDAAINPGNSGGALVDLDGRLVGINTAIASRTGGYEGIGFAIPVDIVRSVSLDLMEQGFVSRGWLGVMLQDIDPGLGGEFSEESGIIVSEVLEGSPADQARLLVGDVIVELDGQPAGSVAEFRNSIAGMDPGDSARLLISRSGQRRTLDVEIGELPVEIPAETARQIEEETSSTTGWTLTGLDPRTAESLGYSGEGVLIASVEPGGSAARSGLAQGDIMVEVDRVPVSSVDEARRLVAASGSEALLLVFRGGHTVFILLELD